MRLPILMMILVILIAGITFGADQKYVQARVTFDSFSQMKQLMSMHLDVMHAAKNFYEIVTDEKELGQLRDLGLDVEIIHEDMEQFYRDRFDGKIPSDYLTLTQLNSELLFRHMLYPDITTERFSIGQSLQGREIYAIKISDNPDVDEDEPEVFYNAAIHAREVITPLVLIHFMDYLLDNYGIDPEVTELIDEREIWIVPVVNVDGYQYNVDYGWPGGMWRKNRRDNGDGTFGVDLNRNFGYQWGYDDDGSSPEPGDETFRGTAPFSEPVTQVIRDFVNSRQFVVCMNYHSGSNLYLWAYAYNNSFTPDEDIFRALGDSMNSWSGYEAGLNAIGYPVNGGADDWMYGEQTTKPKIMGMTAEVGGYYSDGFWPEINRIPELVEENLQPNLFIAKIAGHLTEVLPPGMAIVSAPDSVSNGSDYDVEWSIADTRNPAVNYELVEMTDYAIQTDPADDFRNWEHRYFDDSSGVFFSGTDNYDFRYLKTIQPYTVLPGDSFTFQTKYSLSQDIDYAYVQISTDGETFYNLPGNITTNDNPYGINEGNGINGYTNNNWVEASFDLSDYVGESVYFRIYYKVFQKAWASQGIWLDDIHPVVGFDSYNFITTTDSTYNFAGNPEGIYYYKVRAQDDDSQWSGYSETKSVVVGNPIICADPDDDGYGIPGYPGSSCPDDNCPFISNADQADADGDGVGDVCDDCTDTDGDGFGDPGFAANTCDIDNCPDTANPSQDDPDADSVGSVCDNCPEAYNPGQVDTDGDGLGNACDFLCGDINGDWVVNIFDVTGLINYLYRGGVPPVDMNSADVNSDATVNIFDVTYLISALYQGGPAPNCQ